MKNKNILALVASVTLTIFTLCFIGCASNSVPYNDLSNGIDVMWASSKKSAETYAEFKDAHPNIINQTRESESTIVFAITASYAVSGKKTDEKDFTLYSVAYQTDKEEDYDLVYIENIVLFHNDIAERNISTSWQLSQTDIPIYQKEDLGSMSYILNGETITQEIRHDDASFLSYSFNFPNNSTQRRLTAGVYIRNYTICQFFPIVTLGKNKIYQTQPMAIE